MQIEPQQFTKMAGFGLKVKLIVYLKSTSLSKNLGLRNRNLLNDAKHKSKKFKNSKNLTLIIAHIAKKS
jgi:hypothetical protein